MTTEVDHGARAHAKFSASGTERYWECPGSILLSDQVGNVSRTSVYAEEGTAAHEVANLCLESGQDAVEYIDRRVNDFLVDVGMAEAVQVYLDDCRATPVPKSDWMIEARVSLEALNPPAPMFGTADFMAHCLDNKRLYVKDYKHGAGVPVSAVGNRQLRYYGLGALLLLPPGTEVDDVELTIVQPRTPGESIKREVLDSITLMEWGFELLEHVRAALEPTPVLNPGKWCRFCPAAGTCPEQANKGLRAAQMDFQALLDPLNALTGDTPKPPEIRLLTPDQMAVALSQADALEDWLKSLRAAACDVLSRGEAVPGWKLVAKRPAKKWVDNEDTAGEILIRSFGLPEEEVFKKKLVTPTQAEALLTKQYQGRDYKAADAKKAAKELLSGMHESVSSGPTLAAESDARPAIAGRGSEFTLDVPDPE